MTFVGTSAKSGDGVEAIFDKIIEQIDQEQVEFFQQRTRKDTIALNGNSKGKGKGGGGKSGKGKSGGKCC